MTAQQTTTPQPVPVLILTRDRNLGAQLRELAPEVPAVEIGRLNGSAPVIGADGLRAVFNAGWNAAPAVLIGADMLREVCELNPPARAGVYILSTPDAPAYLPGVAVAPGVVVEIAQPDAPAWLAARLRHLAAGGDPGTPPNGCEECGAAPGKPCREANCQGTWH